MSPATPTLTTVILMTRLVSDVVDRVPLWCFIMCMPWAGQFALDGCVPGCESSWQQDGECDEVCNVAECEFDGGDCFEGTAHHKCCSTHVVISTFAEVCGIGGSPGFGECYTQSDGRDYRGAVSVTAGGIPCQSWSHMFPHNHMITHTNFPNGGLGGHSHCRNPDGDIAPYCFTTNPDVRWDYCNISAPSTTGCNHSLPAPHAPNITEVPLNVMVQSDAREHEHKARLARPKTTTTNDHLTPHS